MQDRCTHLSDFLRICKYLRCDCGAECAAWSLRSSPVRPQLCCMQNQLGISLLPVLSFCCEHDLLNREHSRAVCARKVLAIHNLLLICTWTIASFQNFCQRLSPFESLPPGKRKVSTMVKLSLVAFSITIASRNSSNSDLHECLFRSPKVLL